MRVVETRVLVSVCDVLVTCLRVREEEMSGAPVLGNENAAERTEVCGLTPTVETCLSYKELQVKAQF